MQPCIYIYIYIVNILGSIYLFGAIDNYSEIIYIYIVMFDMY